MFGQRTQPLRIPSKQDYSTEAQEDLFNLVILEEETKSVESSDEKSFDKKAKSKTTNSPLTGVALRARAMSIGSGDGTPISRSLSSGSSSSLHFKTVGLDAENEILPPTTSSYPFFSAETKQITRVAHLSHEEILEQYKDAEIAIKQLDYDSLYMALGPDHCFLEQKYQKELREKRFNWLEVECDYEFYTVLSNTVNLFIEKCQHAKILETFRTLVIDPLKRDIEKIEEDKLTPADILSKRDIFLCPTFTWIIIDLTCI